MSFFMTFEGIEGCGKSTQVQLLTRALANQGIDVLVTREPGGCAIADKIRGILLDADNSRMMPLAELLLYAAARAQHVAEVVKPALDAGKTVICDRFTDATIAYQGFGRQLDQNVIGQLNELATTGLRPDLTILLDCPVETGLKRAFDRINNCTGSREERFELESANFHERVRQGYLALAEKETERFLIVDASSGIAETGDAIKAAVNGRLKNRLHR